MSHKSLLFCPDEKTTRTVTQVLSELDFTVESAPEPAAAVKRLAEERFDALVVDCQSEQDAALLFKTARDSNRNHSCLSVAVVEGQSGVAKAFRIGANLVLTKPINIEQSKGTLRVARGLLRKNELRVPQSAFYEEKNAPQPTAGTDRPASLIPAATMPATAITPKFPAARAASIAPSAFEPEPEPTRAPEPADRALLDSLPSPWGTSRPSNPPAPQRVEPLSISVRDLGAAAAPALENRRPLELKPVSVPPMVSKQPIVNESSLTPSAPAPLADFSAVDENRNRNRLLQIAGVVIAFCVVGYLGWKLHWLDRALALHPAQNTSPAPAAHPPTQQSVPAAEAVIPPQSDLPSETPSVSSKPTSIPSRQTTASHDVQPETIDVQELPMSPDSKAGSKPAPLIVKTGTGRASIARENGPQQPGPPPLEVASGNDSKSALAAIVASPASVPRIAPHTVEVSQGVSQGLLLKKVAPAYPSLAWQSRKEGTVELLATISREGTISDVKVLKGDVIFVRSATDAVRQWKYRPYLLNGQPVEIKTQITVNFTMPR
jgi:TonB family protein